MKPLHAFIHRKFYSFSYKRFAAFSGSAQPPHAQCSRPLTRTGGRSPRTRLLSSTGSRDCALPYRFSPREKTGFETYTAMKKRTRQSNSTTTTKAPGDGPTIEEIQQRAQE